MSSSANRAAIYSSATDDWPTPQAFYDRLDDEFGFVLDVCSSTTNHKAPAFYAQDHADESRRDGLTQDWAAEAAELGGTVWMNPPYGKGIDAWMKKAFSAARAGATVVCLVPVRANTAWWHDTVLGTGAEVRYLRGRLKFGAATAEAPFANAVVIYRPTDHIGTVGPVATMNAKSEGAALKSRSACRAANPLEVAWTIDSYTPREMSTLRWTVAAPAVREAVAATRPANKRLARARLVAVVNLLETKGAWSGRSAPNLTRLLSNDRIDAHLTTASTPAVVATRGAHLRMVSRAIRAATAA